VGRRGGAQARRRWVGMGLGRGEGEGGGEGVEGVGPLDERGMVDRRMVAETWPVRVKQGVFDFIAVGGQARRPGRGQPWPSSRGTCSLFDLYARDEPDSVELVFDFCFKKLWILSCTHLVDLPPLSSL
jgi:hypothetical protein